MKLSKLDYIVLDEIICHYIRTIPFDTQILSYDSILRVCKIRTKYGIELGILPNFNSKEINKFAKEMADNYLKKH